MNEAEEMIRARSTFILYPPVMFYDIFDRGIKIKKLKAIVTPKPRYSTI